MEQVRQNQVNPPIQVDFVLYTKKVENLDFIRLSTAFIRAADGNRTRDLRTTNATLYRLSHSSNFTFALANLVYIITGI